jgi:GntR family transcriptional regulator
MSIDRTSPLPLWAQVATDLRRRLGAGEFDERFPAEHQLVARYGVSRGTIREAMARLRHEGLLDRQRGRGTFRARTELEQPLRGLYSLARSIVAQGLSEHSQVLRTERRLAGESATLLEIPAREPVVYLERLRYAGEEPLALDRVWLPAAVAAPLFAADLTHGSIYEALEQHCGTRVSGGWERITPVIPHAKDRRLLRLPPGEAALGVERLTRSGGRPLEWRRSLIRGDRYSLTTEWGP